jgi:hypothetical protein
VPLLLGQHSFTMPMPPPAVDRSSNCPRFTAGHRVVTVVSAAVFIAAVSSGASVAQPIGPILLDQGSAISCAPGTRLSPMPGPRGAISCVPYGDRAATVREQREIRREQLRLGAGREGDFKPPDVDPWSGLQRARPASAARPLPTDPAQIRPEYVGSSTVRPEFSGSGAAAPR